MTTAGIYGAAFLGSITLIVFSIGLFLRSKRGQRWLEQHS
jgi:hypothetical protein